MPRSWRRSCRVAARQSAGDQRPVGFVPGDLTEAAPAKVNLFLHVTRPAGRRLPPARQPRGVRRRRRHAARGTGGDAVADGRGTVRRGAGRGAGQPGAARRAGLGGGGRRRGGRAAGAGQASAGGIAASAAARRMPRRRCGCCAGYGGSSRIPGSWPGWRLRSARMCRSASPAAPAGWAVSASIWSRRRRCRRAACCWSIPAWRWRPPRCSGRAAAHGPRAAELPAAWRDAGELAGDLRRQRNDLEPPAIALCPVIGDVLSVLEAAPGCLLARMSGSGATCFGLFADAAGGASGCIGLQRPGWWCWGGGLRRG